MGNVKRERLLKSKMASSDGRFTFEIVHVLRFGKGLNEELYCRFIFTNLQQSGLGRQSEKFSRIGACIRCNITP